MHRRLSSICIVLGSIHTMNTIGYVELDPLCVQVSTSCVGLNSQHPISAAQYPGVELGQQHTLRFIIQIPPGGWIKYVEIDNSYTDRWREGSLVQTVLLQ